MELAVVWLFVALLQYTQVLVSPKPSSQPSSAHAPGGSLWSRLCAAGSHADDAVTVNLHTMGALFLPVWTRRIFFASVFLHLMSILVSYTLAGSAAYARESLGLVVGQSRR